MHNYSRRAVHLKLHVFWVQREWKIFLDQFFGSFFFFFGSNHPSGCVTVLSRYKLESCCQMEKPTSLDGNRKKWPILLAQSLVYVHKGFPMSVCLARLKTINKTIIQRIRRKVTSQDLHWQMAVPPGLPTPLAVSLAALQLVLWSNTLQISSQEVHLLSTSFYIFGLHFTLKPKHIQKFVRYQILI